ncbi:MAG: ATP-binding protein [Planctomycetaceae bacterium]|nr:ATP-binding protein [Planctomycetaceae bacterium]
MSLWHKTLSEISFADIDAFCRTMQPENSRLDYKVEVPKDLAKTISAFANTLGGLIVIGVDSDKTNNTPIWPPTDGMKAAPGISERIVQFAQDSIYPPVRVGLSNVIENDLLPGHSLIVIRLDESRDAPHAIDGRRHVYVYERTDNKNDPHRHAEIDRILHLMQRRQRIVDDREHELQENLARAERTMRKDNLPIRWVSASPVYPWREIVTPEFCAKAHSRIPIMSSWSIDDWKYQRFVRGSFAVGRESQGQQKPTCIGVSNISANGTLFCAVFAKEATFKDSEFAAITGGTLPAGPVDNVWIDMSNVRSLVQGLLTGAQTLYRESKSPPGELFVSIGLRNIHRVFFHDREASKKSRAEFPDAEYRVDKVITLEELKNDFMGAVQSMFDDMAFALNAHDVNHG